MSGGLSSNADADIFFEMEGLDGPEPPMTGNSQRLLQPVNLRLHRAGSYDNADDDEDENNYGT